jgi:protein-tyrosine phosphatase
MNRYGVEWSSLCELYQRHGIKAINIEIVDRKNRDFVAKCRHALKVLTFMVEKYGKVYVHCTAGIYRSPQLIVLFLVHRRRMTLNDALDLIKRRRSFVRPSV